VGIVSGEMLNLTATTFILNSITIPSPIFKTNYEKVKRNEQKIRKRLGFIKKSLRERHMTPSSCL